MSPTPVWKCTSIAPLVFFLAHLGAFEQALSAAVLVQIDYP